MTLILRSGPSGYRKCLVPDCDGVANARGLCVGCYAHARSMIEQSKTTWSELERHGLAVPAKPRGRRARLEKALDEAREGTDGGRG